MSTTIDQRVVEMQFDNRNFEKNVNTSMSTLDKLKQKLNLSGASKGLENINAAAKNNNLSALGNAASTVASKFSAMEIVGITTLANLTNSAVNAGKRMIAALTIDPVKTGFSEYELKMDSVKTIMASTGESVETVNKYLNELNEYSDQTIYSFSDMTQNIGKFTNAGVKLEDAVLAIKGISNEAAVSGANANEASRAMYNFAQALSAGYVKLIDWKSIENANMATVEFKQQLIDTALELGTVTKSADGMYETLSGKTFNATQNFNDVLQEQWMTSEVLVETLKDYADESTEIGKKAKAAAQDVTKLTQIFDIAKETAQSGWARTWELIFGDINQAKALFTPISNFINGIIDGISDFRNDILELALAGPFKGIKETLDKVTGSVDAVTKATKELGVIVDEVIGGKWGNGQERWDALTKAGYNWAEVQNKVNEKLGNSYRHTVKLTDAQGELQKSQSRTVEEVLAMSDAQLKNLGLTEKEIESIRELQKASEKTGIPIEELIKDIDQLSGRSLLINSFKNAGAGLAQVFKSMKDAWVDIFPPKSTEERAKGLYNIIAAMHKFTRQFKDMMSNTDEGSTFDKLVRTFKGLFAAMDIVATIVAGPFKLAFKVLKAILSAFNMDILDLTAVIGDAIVGFRNWFKEHDLITSAVKKLIPFVKKAIDVIGDWFDSFKDSKFISNFIDNLKSLAPNLTAWIEGIKEAENIPKYIIDGLVNGLKSGVKAVINGIINLGKTAIEAFKGILGIHSPSTVFFEFGKNMIQGLINGLKDGFTAVWNVLKDFGSKCINVLGNIDWGSVLMVGTVVSFLGIAYKFAGALGTLAGAFHRISNAFHGLGEMFQDIGQSFKKLASGLKFKFMGEGIKDMAIAIALLVASIVVLTFFDPMDLLKAVGIITLLAGVLVGLSIAMSKISKTSMSFKKGEGFMANGGLGSTLLALAAAILLISLVVKMIGKMDPEEAKQGFIGLSIALATMLGVIFIYGKIVKGDAAKNADKVGKLLTKMAIAMLLMIVVVKLMSKLTWDELGKGAVGMAGFVLFVAAIAKAVKGKPGDNVDKLGKMLVKMAIAMALMVGVVKLISMLEWKEMGKGAVGMAGFALFVLVMTQILKKAGTVNKMGGTLLAMAASMLIMVGVIKLISMMKWSALAKGFIGILALTAIMNLMVKMVKDIRPYATKMAGTILAMALSIGILGAIAVLLSMVDTKNLAKGIIAVGLLSAMMSLMIYATKGANKCIGNLIVITVAIAVLAGAVALLSFLDASKIQKISVSLALLMVAFAALIAVSKIADKSKSLGKSLLMILGVVAVLALILGVMSALNVEASVGTAVALGVLLLALSASLLILDHVGTISTSALIGMYALSGVVAILAVILGVMSSLYVEGSIQTAISIGILLTAMSAALLIASYAGPNALLSVAALALMAVVVGLLAVVLGLMDHFNVEPSIETAAALSLLLIAMSAALVLLAGVGLLGPAALIGIGSLAALIVGIGALIVGIGALFDNFPMLEDFLDKGIPILQKIGEGLGKFFGGIVGGFMEGVADSLPYLGTCLSEFITNAQPFINGVKQVDGTALAGVGILAAAILALTAADLIAGIASFLTGGSSFADLGTELSLFMTNAQGFLDGMGTIDASTVEAVKSLAQAILIITAAELLDGITSFFTGSASLAKFASQLPLLGEGIVGLLTTLGDISLDRVGEAADAVKTLASAAQEIPNAGGLLAAFVGDNKLGTFAAEFPKVGEGLRDFVIACNGVNLNSVEPAAKAVKTFADVAKDIPNAGGLLAGLVGDNKLGTFASEFPKVGVGLRDFVIACGGVNLTSVEPAAKAVKTFADVAKEIPNAGGLLAGFVGDNRLGTFATEFPKLGTGLRDFVIICGGCNLTSVGPAADAVAKFAKVAQDIPNAGGLLAAFVGDNKLGTFASEFPKLGAGLRDFVINCGGINFVAVETGANATATFVNLAKTIDGGSLNGSGLANFGNNIAKLGGHLEKFNGHVGGLDLSFLNTLLTRLDRLITMSGFETSGLVSFGSNFKSMGENLKKGYDAIKKVNMDGFATILDGVDKMSESIKKASSVNSSGLPALGANFASFGAKLKEGYTAVKGITMNTLSKAVNSFGEVVKSANSIATIDTGSINDFASTLDNLGDSVSDFISSSSTFKNSGANMVTKMVDGFESKSSNLTRTVTNLIKEAHKKVDGYNSDFKSAGTKLMTNLISGINGKKSSVRSAATSSISSAVSGVKSYYSDFYSAGSYLVTGFTNGISANMYKAAAKAKAMAKAAVDAAEEELGIESPSKVFYRIGGFAGQGFINALGDYTSKTYDAGSEMADSARSGLKDSINKVLGLISGTMDVQPTIRPVLDLSSVESGMGVISGMFSDDASIGVTSNLRAISSSIGRYGQNGGNDDVVSAIDKLGKHLNSQGNIYNINGITYDDGSNVSNAIETLIRAARVERRV